MGSYDCKRCFPIHLFHPTHSKYRHWPCRKIQHLVTMLVSLAWCEGLIHVSEDFPSKSASPSLCFPCLFKQGGLSFSNCWFDFCQTHGLSKESGLSIGVSAPAWGSGEGLESSGFQTPLKVRHGSGKPWRVVVLKHTDGMQDFQGLNGIKNGLSWMIITPMVLIDPLKVYEIIGPRISTFDFVPSRLHNVFAYTWVGYIYVATGTLWEPSNASWNEKRSSVQQIF